MIQDHASAASSVGDFEMRNLCLSGCSGKRNSSLDHTIMVWLLKVFAGLKPAIPITAFRIDCRYQVFRSSFQNGGWKPMTISVPGCSTR